MLALAKFVRFKLAHCNLNYVQVESHRVVFFDRGERRERREISALRLCVFALS